VERSDGPTNGATDRLAKPDGCAHAHSLAHSGPDAHTFTHAGANTLARADSSPYYVTSADGVAHASHPGADLRPIADTYRATDSGADHASHPGADLRPDADTYAHGRSHCYTRAHHSDTGRRMPAAGRLCP
jgi:hypothetical protein